MEKGDLKENPLSQKERDPAAQRGKNAGYLSHICQRRKFDRMGF